MRIYVSCLISLINPHALLFFKKLQKNFLLNGIILVLPFFGRGKSGKNGNFRNTNGPEMFNGQVIKTQLYTVH